MSLAVLILFATWLLGCAITITVMRSEGELGWRALLLGLLWPLVLLVALLVIAANALYYWLMYPKDV